MKIFGVTANVSPTSLEFKMLQEGFALMQKNDSTYNLRTGSNHYVNMEIAGKGLVVVREGISTPNAPYLRWQLCRRRERWKLEPRVAVAADLWTALLWLLGRPREGRTLEVAEKAEDEGARCCGGRRCFAVAVEGGEGWSPSGSPFAPATEKGKKGKSQVAGLWFLFGQGLFWYLFHVKLLPQTAKRFDSVSFTTFRLRCPGCRNSVAF
ncbi:hypothetical protein NC651_007551 [Populus alba x Populus x berolinensis]|nr:hypothetical protein NC651_007551 [Populus alba x Populus x berolinensis]